MVNSITMLIDPDSLKIDLERLEAIEKASLRLVSQALFDYRNTAAFIFENETDTVADVGEDITREALDRMGVSRIDQRLFGKIDYKRATYLFLPDFAVRQALFVDSKAEKAGENVARIQITQLSMRVRQVRFGEELDIPGRLPAILVLPGNQKYLSTTIFVKYIYSEKEGTRKLLQIKVIALPNGLLQEQYNPTALDTIFIAGPNAPSLGEEFRTRLSFRLLQQKAKWRVQQILINDDIFVWTE